MALLESVPNVSEGRNPEVVEAIGAAYASHGAHVLDVHVDADHHRSVHTLAGADEALVEALVAGIAEAVRLVDLRAHGGVHPRVGAADVVPVVPVDPADAGRAAEVALEVGRRVGETLALPVLLYGAVGGGRRPAFYRRGGLDELTRRMAAGEVEASFGPDRPDPRAGAVILGVRDLLVAFNVVLATDDVEVARRVATSVRASGGGMPGVQALGLTLASTGRAQVSMNIVDVDASDLHAVVERVRALAAREGVGLEAGELVGLLPARVVARAALAAGVGLPLDDDGLPTAVALEAAATAFVLPTLSADRVLEVRLAALASP